LAREDLAASFEPLASTPERIAENNPRGRGALDEIVKELA